MAVKQFRKLLILVNNNTMTNNLVFIKVNQTFFLLIQSLIKCLTEWLLIYFLTGFKLFGTKKTLKITILYLKKLN